MSAETLITAAHRLDRFFRVDMKNGLVVDETIFAHLTLTREIELARKGKPHDPALVRLSCSRRSSLMAEIIFHSAIACRKTGRDAVLRGVSKWRASATPRRS